MRRVFIVLAKIVGIVLLYQWLVYLSSMLIIFSSLSDFSAGKDTNVFLQIVGVAGYIFLSVGVVWLLLIKTEWLADKLGINEDDLLPALTVNVAVRVGFKLIGIYIFLVAMPRIFNVIFRAGSYGWMGGLTKHIWTGALPAVVQVVLALFLMIRTDRVLRVIEKGEKTQGKHIVVVGLLVFALLVFVGFGVAKTKWSEFNPNVSSYAVTRGCNNKSVTDEPMPIDDEKLNESREWYALQYEPEMTNSSQLVTNTAVKVIVLP